MWYPKEGLRVTSLDTILNEIIAKIETPRASLLLIKILKEEGKTYLAIQACLKVLEIFPDDLNIRKFLSLQKKNYLS